MKGFDFVVKKRGRGRFWKNVEVFFVKVFFLIFGVFLMFFFYFFVSILGVILCIEVMF